MHILCIGVNHQKVARHLVRVAAGLDSQVLGEPQILRQVTESHMTALRFGSTGPVLSRLFQSAVHAGKRVRNESAISSRPSTVSSIAVKLASDAVGGLAQAKVVVTGAGEMAELAIGALTRALVKKLPHFPTVYLKEKSRYGELLPGAKLTRKLFGLDDGNPDDMNHQYIEERA
ncbi:MAG: hypothetical protein ACRDHG_03155 [Anaerolineales bacterium]